MALGIIMEDVGQCVEVGLLVKLNRVGSFSPDAPRFLLKGNQDNPQARIFPGYL